MTSQQEVSNSFFLVHFLSQNLKLFLDFMAFTGNFYDWIWFSRITTDLLTPLIPLIAFYINGVRMALFFSTLEHDSVSWIFRQFCSEKKGRIWKGEGGIVAADSFQIDWKKRGEIGKSTISIREKMPILWLFYFLMLQTLFWLLNSFNWLISFQIDHLDNSWSITHSICCSWKKSIDFWLSSCAKTWSNYQQRPQDINNIPIKYPEGPTTFSHLLLHWS